MWASIVSPAEPDASAFRLISRRALAHGFWAHVVIDARTHASETRLPDANVLKENSGVCVLNAV